mmetsp:Transcript_103256/g.301197  ORF Transcript_103256/g.301197 Transcript_103256/m.301197 type:complete len:224 (-) Transcript_103256:225-896(-)
MFTPKQRAAFFRPRGLRPRQSTSGTPQAGSASPDSKSPRRKHIMWLYFTAPWQTSSTVPKCATLCHSSRTPSTSAAALSTRPSLLTWPLPLSRMSVCTSTAMPRGGKASRTAFTALRNQASQACGVGAKFWTSHTSGMPVRIMDSGEMTPGLSHSSASAQMMSRRGGAPTATAAGSGDPAGDAAGSAAAAGGLLDAAQDPESELGGGTASPSAPAPAAARPSV